TEFRRVLSRSTPAAPTSGLSPSSVEGGRHLPTSSALGTSPQLIVRLPKASAHHPFRVISVCLGKADEAVGQSNRRDQVFTRYRAPDMSDLRRRFGRVGYRPLARRCSRKAWARIIRSISDGATLSSAAGGRAAARSSGPHRTNSAFGTACCRVCSSGIEPPLPASPGALP